MDDMKYAFSIIMFCMGGAILLYSGLLALTKDAGLIPKAHTAKMTDKKRYAAQFAKTMAIVAVSPLLSGIAGLFGNGIVNAVVAVISFIICIVIAVKTFKPEPPAEE